MLKEFRDFAIKGNAVDLAIGIVIGAAFGAIVSSLVNDIIMPPIGLLLGNVNFASLMIVLKEGSQPPPYATPVLAKNLGAVTVNYGVFLNVVITFLIVALVVFLIVKAINRMRSAQDEEATTKDCPYCATEIPLAATRCPACTSDLAVQ
jgi:large conductance mechanosensitive channel